MCREISDLLFAPAIALENVEELEYLIPNFLSTFVELFPNEMKPKFHYLLHYPTQIKKLGPLSHIWCMRFEGKHQYFKRIASQLSNFRNVSFSLAKRHQLRACWEMLSDDFLEREAKAENMQPIRFNELPDRLQESVLQYCEMTMDDVEEDEMVLTCKALHFNAVHHAIKYCFIVDLVHTEKVPVFLKITDILNFRSKWLLYGSIYIAKAFNKHMHGYEVEGIDTWCVLEAGKEIDYHGLDMYSVGDSKIIILHHAPFL